jgi:hypothetical protein
VSGCGGSRHDAGMTTPITPLPTDTASGTVTFNGSPLAGVTITEWSTNSNEVLATATTDANGNYSFSGISTSGDVPLELNLWAMKKGFGFSPSVESGAKVERYDHTGQFEPTASMGAPMYFTVIDYVALPNASLSGANFAAYDGTNPPVSVAATGQNASAVAGDDGALKKGVAWPETRFADNQDGTVTDSLTGLVWLKDAGCLGTAVWSDALAAANQLTSGSCGLADGSKAGDWRLPNLVELESVIDASASNPALNAGNPFAHAGNELYWTSTSYFGGEEGSPQAWAIRMADGRYVNDGSQNVKASANNGVWAVRGTGSGAARPQATGLYVPFQSGDDGTLQKGVPLIFPRFIENGNGTVTDTVTGLTWLKQANCIQGDWATAVAAVNVLASGQCGLTDGSAAGAWRMPNRKELQSLADRNENNEADYLDYTFLNPDQTVFQTAVFMNFIPSQYYWTSTTDATNPSEAWTVFSCDYGVYDTAKSAMGYTLAVR